MNSPQENKPDRQQEQPKQPAKSHTELIEEAMGLTIMEVIQLRRTLWLIVKQSGGKVVLDETQISPLWNMKATRTEDKKLQLEATLLPEPTDAQLAVIASMLDGTRMDIEDAMKHSELNQHPPFYIENALRNRVVRGEDGYWVDVGVARIAAESEKALPGNN